MRRRIHAYHMRRRINACRFEGKAPINGQGVKPRKKEES
jgi:hypothetical protein